MNDDDAGEVQQPLHPAFRVYLPPISFFSSFFLSSSALVLVASFFPFWSAGAGSFANAMGVPNPTARNAAKTIICAKRVMMKPPWWLNVGVVLDTPPGETLAVRGSYEER